MYKSQQGRYDNEKLPVVLSTVSGLSVVAAKLSRPSLTADESKVGEFTNIDKNVNNSIVSDRGNCSEQVGRVATPPSPPTTSSTSEPCRNPVKSRCRRHTGRRMVILEGSTGYYCSRTVVYSGTSLNKLESTAICVFFKGQRTVVSIVCL